MFKTEDECTSHTCDADGAWMLGVWLYVLAFVSLIQSSTNRCASSDPCKLVQHSTLPITRIGSHLRVWSKVIVIEMHHKHRCESDYCKESSHCNVSTFFFYAEVSLAQCNVGRGRQMNVTTWLITVFFANVINKNVLCSEQRSYRGSKALENVAAAEIYGWK